MANLNMDHAAGLVLGAMMAEDRVAYWAQIAAIGLDAELILFINALGTQPPGGFSVRDSLVRGGDAIQELQAALPSIRVASRMDSKDATGEVDVEFIPST